MDSNGKWTQLVNGRHGQFLVNSNDIYVGRCLIDYGEFSEGEAELFTKLVKPGMIVIEAGANIGSLTVPIARSMQGQGILFAFEPMLFNFYILCANVALNGFTNVKCVQAACGESPGTINVPLVDPRKRHNFGGVPLRDIDVPDGESVRLVSIDAMNLPALHFLKIDVERMELEVLCGARQTIERCRPIIYCECEHNRDAIVAFLQGMGYEVNEHSPTLYRRDNFFGGQPSDTIPENLRSLNLLCLPKTTS